MKFVEDAIDKSGDKNLNEKFKKLKVKLNEKSLIKNIEIENYYSQSTEGVYSNSRKNLKIKK